MVDSCTILYKQTQALTLGQTLQIHEAIKDSNALNDLSIRSFTIGIKFISLPFPITYFMIQSEHLKVIKLLLLYYILRSIVLLLFHI